MPPRRSPFGVHGSADDSDVKVSGKELGEILGLYHSKCFIGWNFVLAACAGAVGIALNIVMGSLMTNMTAAMDPASGKDLDDVIKEMILNLFACVFGQLTVMTIMMLIRVLSVSDVMTDLRDELYTAMINQDVEFFDRTATGILVSRLSEDLTLIRQTYFDKSYQVCQSSAQTIVNLIVAFIYSWRVTLVCFPCIPLSGVVFWVGECFVDKLWVEYNETSTAAADKAEEIITSFRIVKSFDKEMDEAENYKGNLDGVNRVYNKTSIVDGAKNGIISFLIQGMMAIIFYYSCWIMIRRPQWDMAIGDMMVCMMCVMNATMGVTQLLAIYTDFRKAAISGAKVLEIIKSKPKVDRKIGNTLERVQGKIEFRDVSFKYAGREEFAVEHLSFVIPAGQTVAFVGESGCGKSTTLQLLQRFYEINSGEILLDDVNIQSLSQVFLRSQISVVPQGPVLFSMSILDNIRYAKPEATKQEVADAARIGNAHNFIMEQPKNYDTIVQQTSLSGGQKQRICISRSIVQSTPILLLDEATAALDTESEQLVQQSLEQFRHGKTAIMVAHRLATVKNADKIFVFANGHVEEEGSFTELISKDGLFADLVKYQLQ